MAAKWDLGIDGGIAVVNPIPVEYEIPAEEINGIIDQTIADMDAAGITPGHATAPRTISFSGSGLRGPEQPALGAGSHGCRTRIVVRQSGVLTDVGLELVGKDATSSQCVGGHQDGPADIQDDRHNAPVPSYVDLSATYVDLDRSAWSRLRDSTPLTLTEVDLAAVAGLGDRIDLDEVSEVYLPLSRLIDLHVGAVRGLRGATSLFLGEPAEATPFVIGIAGSVAVGKSTTARLLRHLISHWPATPHVELVTTDGFLLPNAELERRNLLHRKGFPESYDRRALLSFVGEVKSGRAEVTAPVYSHLTYDIVPNEHVVVRRPDVLIVEGLNVLQPAPYLLGRSDHYHRRDVLSLSDLFDFSIYVHAKKRHIRRWYVERFLRLRETAFADPHSYFHRYAALTDDEAVATARRLWATINEPNLVQNVRPTRDRARVVLTKDADHAVSRIRLRKL